MEFPKALSATAEPPKPIDLTAEAYDLLLTAIPALEPYAARQKGHAAAASASVEPPEDVAETRLWPSFLLERDEMLRHKWNRSQELGHDIGLQYAIKEWLQIHRTLWAVQHEPAPE